MTFPVASNTSTTIFPMASSTHLFLRKSWASPDSHDGTNSTTVQGRWSLRPQWPGRPTHLPPDSLQPRVARWERLPDIAGPLAVPSATAFSRTRLSVGGNTQTETYTEKQNQQTEQPLASPSVQTAERRVITTVITAEFNSGNASTASPEIHVFGSGVLVFEHRVMCW